MELVLKESLSIRTTPEDMRFNRDSGYELPGCWIATYKKLKGGAPGQLEQHPLRPRRTNTRGAQSGMRTNQNLLYFALSDSL